MGLKKTEGNFSFVLSAVPFVALNAFLECLCSEFVVSGKIDPKMKTSGVPVDIEGLPSKEHGCWSVLNCSGWLYKSCCLILREISSLFRSDYFGVLKTSDFREKNAVTWAHQWCTD